MEISLQMPTHGLMWRDETDAYLPRPDRHVDVVGTARLAEDLGFHSLWFSDHVFMPRTTGVGHPANTSGKRAYPDDAYMLDALVSMGAAAAATSRIQLAPAVLVSPTRHPLSDARQFMTVDVISNGRVIAGVGSGWQKEEFDALGLPFEGRGRMLEECVEIYLRCWKDDWVEFHGEFYDFADVSVDPKPIRVPPVIYGANSRAGARRAAKNGNGLYLIFLDPYSDPFQYADFFTVVEEEANKVGRTLDEFEFSGMISTLPTDADNEFSKSTPRRIMTGTPEQILEDVQRFADAGYSRCTLQVESRSGTVTEYMENLERWGREILPEAKKIATRVPAI